MRSSILVLAGAAALAAALAFVGLPPGADAHCDTMDGPVVVAAKAAIEKGDVTPVLRWVPADEEPAVKEAFAKTLAARRASAEARDVADRWFFETLVRVHRAGEGEPYTGLKPTGAPVEPGIAEADAAVASGDVDHLATALAEAVSDGIRTRFARVVETKRDADKSVAAGRAHVAAYVEFMHYVERVHAAAAAGSSHGCGDHGMDK